MFRERPRDIQRLLEYVLSDPQTGPSIDADRIGFFGFSRGGYTGLVLAGATPDFFRARLPCPDPYAKICQQTAAPDMDMRTYRIVEPRIKALVLADPLNAFADEKALRHVGMPIQLWISHDGGDGVLPAQVHALVQTLPSPPETHLAPDAGHFAFLAVCPPLLKRQLPAICQDRPGFDRAAFHRSFNDDVVGFFRKSLGR